jgi:PST family polysaccharide transporter
MAETTLIGRGLGAAALGNYRYGTRIGTLPGMAVFEIGSYVVFPAFSRIAGDGDRLHAAFLRALRSIWIAAAPIAALVVALGEQAVTVVFGDPWRDAGLFLVAVAGYGLGNALQAVAGEAIKAAGRSALMNWISAIELVLGVGLVVALLPFGLVGVGLAVSVTEITSGIVLLMLAKPIVGYRFGELVRTLTPPLVAACVGLAVVLGLIRVFGSPTELPTATALAALVALTLSLALSYLVTLAALDRSLRSVLRGKLIRR